MEQAAWTIEATEEYARSAKPWLKRHKRELSRTHDNLDTLVKALQAGTLAQQVRQSFGFVHNEPDGIIAIDQKGAGPHTKETRLYVWLDGIEHIVFVLRLGDKGSQQDDIEHCRRWVKAKKESKRRRPPPDEP